VQAIPNRPFEYTFLDEDFNRQYVSEIKFGQLFFNFSVLAIFISCLGLLGLAAYSTIQRTKEIGVRKVLGASVSSIVNLLSIDFVKLVFIAFLFASPVAWFAMNLAARLCLSYPHHLVDLCPCRLRLPVYRHADHQLPGHKSRRPKPHKKPLDGMMP